MDLSRAIPTQVMSACLSRGVGLEAWASLKSLSLPPKAYTVTSPRSSPRVVSTSCSSLWEITARRAALSARLVSEARRVFSALFELTPALLHHELIVDCGISSRRAVSLCPSSGTISNAWRFCSSVYFGAGITPPVSRRRLASVVYTLILGAQRHLAQFHHI